MREVVIKIANEMLDKYYNQSDVSSVDDCLNHYCESNDFNKHEKNYLDAIVCHIKNRANIRKGELQLIARVERLKSELIALIPQDAEINSPEAEDAFQKQYEMRYYEEKKRWSGTPLNSVACSLLLLAGDEIWEEYVNRQKKDEEKDEIFK